MSTKKTSKKSKQPATKPEVEEQDMKHQEAEMKNEESDDSETMETTSESGEVTKVRRPRGVFVVVAGNVLTGSGMSLIHEEIQVSRGSDGGIDAEQARKEAAGIFKQQHRAEPEFAVGPFYRVNPQTSGEHKTRASISLKTGRKYNFSGKIGFGIYKGWKGVVNFTENPEVLYWAPIELVNEAEAGEKKLRPSATYYKSSEVQMLE